MTDNSDPGDNSGRNLSHEIPASAIESPVQITELSMRAIRLFQSQSALMESLWAFFGTVSLVATLVGLAMPLLATHNLLPHGVPMIFLLFLTWAGYFVFAWGNGKAIRVSQEVLERVSVHAQASSGIELSVVRPAQALFFHKSIVTIVLLIMAVGFWMSVR